MAGLGPRGVCPCGAGAGSLGIGGVKGSVEDGGELGEGVGVGAGDEGGAAVVGWLGATLLGDGEGGCPGAISDPARGVP